ncbi:MAG: DUF4872 domain-containing protein [Candidatus Bathyarchaeota archaeon]|nr:DUF4872 domain-containing protein [Candidatus Bathyarchaeota archaeon]
MAGYDEERGEAYVADSTFKGIQTVTLKSLAEARNSKFEPCPPENAWFEISIPKKIKPLDEATKMAMKETAKNMLNHPEANCGIKGMRFLAEDIINWPKLPISANELKIALFLQYIDLEVAGTGGGNFRKLYSRFLKEATKLLRSKELEGASEKMAESAKLWSEIANLILNSSQKTKIEDINKTLSEAQKKIMQCVKIEEVLFTKLLTL